MIRLIIARLGIVLRQHLGYSLGQLRCRCGEYAARHNVKVTASWIDDSAACFAHDQVSGTDIPRMDAELVIGICSAERHHGHVEGGRTEHTQPNKVLGINFGREQGQ